MTTRKSLFGTDGIRGRVGDSPIDPQSFLHLGWALGQFAQQKRVLIAKDTRLSGYMLESALIAGLTAAGCDVFLTGPLPTPALAYLTQSLGAELGIMITASHNPYYDNGVKIFYQGAHKLSDAQQAQIEELMQEKISTHHSLGKSYRLPDAPGRYLEFLKRHSLLDRLKNCTIILDCAHGAAYKVAPQIFEEYQAIVHTLHDSPNGFNINENAGIMHPSALETMIKTVHSDFAIAFDGDADRVSLYIKGEKCDSHYMLLMLHSLYQRRYGYTGGIVGTQLHNRGLVAYCKSHNIEWVETLVGDRNLTYAALDSGFKIAGEPSGHYILMDKLSTADGLLTALLLIEEIQMGFLNNLQWYKDNVPLFPSFSKSFHKENPRLACDHIDFKNQVHFLENKYPYLKILIRPSGTEPLIRLYIEGQCHSQEFELISQYVQHMIQEEYVFDHILNELYHAKNHYSKLEASLG